MKEAVEDWIAIYQEKCPESKRAWEQTEKGHGRIEKRRLWLVPCAEEMQKYLEQELGWPQMQWCGHIERYRRSTGATEWEEVSTHVWIAGGAFPLELDAERAAVWLREHWGIENGLFRVRDVTMDEDRLHARRTGIGLSAIRNVAITLLRYWIPAKFIPEAQRKVAAMSDHGLHLFSSPI